MCNLPQTDGTQKGRVIMLSFIFLCPVVTHKLLNILITFPLLSVCRNNQLSPGILIALNHLAYSLCLTSFTILIHDQSLNPYLAKRSRMLIFLFKFCFLEERFSLVVDLFFKYFWMIQFKKMSLFYFSLLKYSQRLYHIVSKRGPHEVISSSYSLEACVLVITSN